MLVSIVIPALNEEENVAGTIRSLQALDGHKEILLADGGSTDRTRAIAQSRGVRVIEAPRGRGQQMRAGAMEANGDVLWFVHADTTPPTGALDAIALSLADPSVAGGNFSLAFDGRTRAARHMTMVYPWLRALGLSYGDSGIFVRREVYERIGGFRPLALFEDLDLLKRLRRAGRFVHLPLRMTTSSRRFEQRNFALMWTQWTTLQVLYWCGVPPERLAKYYRHARRHAPTNRPRAI